MTIVLGPTWAYEQRDKLGHALVEWVGTLSHSRHCVERLETKVGLEIILYMLCVGCLGLQHWTSCRQQTRDRGLY